MYKVNYGIKNDQTFFKNILITKINKAKFCSNSFQNLAFYICMKSMLTELVLIKLFYKATLSLPFSLKWVFVFQD